MNVGTIVKLTNDYNVEKGRNSLHFHTPSLGDRGKCPGIVSCDKFQVGIINVQG